MPDLNLNDEAFQRKVTLKECYAIMCNFVVQYNERGESSTVDLLTDIGQVRNGETSDPVQVEDFARVAGQYLDDLALLERVRSQ